MMTDPIGDMLTRIRNAQLARHAKLRVSPSRLKLAVAKILVEEGYLAAVEEHTEGEYPQLEITLRYQSNRPLIRELKRSSKPGRRVYVGCDEIPRVLGGLGTSILSISSGILSGREARRRGIGGELLCTVY